MLCCACLFAFRLLAKADSPTPKLNVAASKIWRDKCFLTKLTFWELLKWINRKNLAENSVAIRRPNVRNIVTAFSDEERPRVDIWSSQQSWQQEITDFPYLYMVFSLRFELSLRFCLLQKNGTVDPTDSSRCQILGSCVTQSWDQRHFQETLCPSTALSTKQRVSLIERKHFNYYRKDICFCKGGCELWMSCVDGF